MTINAEIGAKLKLLGYEIAEYHKDFELGGPWTLWQYPSNGAVHRVGKKMTPSEEHMQNIENLIEEAERRNFYGQSFKQMIDETADMQSQLYGISKEKARVEIIRNAFRFINNPVTDIVPRAKLYEKSISSFMGSIWASYNSTKSNYPAKMAMKELQKLMLDLNEVKQIEAAHKDKFDLIFGSAVKWFHLNKCRYPETNEKDIEEMIKLLKDKAKEY